MKDFLKKEKAFRAKALITALINHGLKPVVSEKG
jgi:hypothetical protein